MSWETSPSDAERLTAYRRRLAELDRERATIARSIDSLSRRADPHARNEDAARDAPQTPVQKVALFRELFGGRDDVFALRWSSTKTGKSVVRVVDYVDRGVPLFARMFSRRLRTYRALGYQTDAPLPF